MDKKQNKKTTLNQLRIVEERFESASLILEREMNADAIPLLYKAVDVLVRILLSSRQKPLDSYKSNIKALEEEFKDEGLWEAGALESFLSLYDKNETYTREMEPEFDEKDVKVVFKNAEDFLINAHKFLKDQLMTSREKVVRIWIKKIFTLGGASIGALIILFFLIKLGVTLFGPDHGLLAHYYDNINLKEPAVVEKINKNIDFVWADMSPHQNITGDFSVRWQGRIKINKEDRYIFTLSTDEGVRLFLDDNVVIDTWAQEDREAEHSGSLTLKKGFHKIRVEYYFNQKHSDIKLLWSTPFSNKKVIGAKYFYPPSE